ncbi:PaaI family thioesterase [Aeromicrobium sp. CTD01-1L150]|uniref:PaaI family thioesterase n=1 Tax=Aeromicrobium sp. CTD01-1L150 TaxID=3341830 RepID=UPI0035C00D8F
MAEPLGLQTAESVLASQPFNDVVGARITEFGGGAATLELDIEPHHLQQYGVVHGGVYAYLADNVLTFAAGSRVGASVITAGFSVSYVRSARAGTLSARGVVSHADDRQAVCTAEIHAVSPEGETWLCAVAQGTIMRTADRSGSVAES